MLNTYKKLNIEDQNLENKNLENQEKTNKNQETKQKPTMKPTKPSGGVAKWIWIALGVLLLFMILSAIMSPRVVDVYGVTTWDDFIAKYPLIVIPDNAKMYIYDYGQYGSRVVETLQIDNTLYVFRFDSWESASSFIDGAPSNLNPININPYRETFWSFLISLLPWILILGGTFWIMKLAMKQQGSIGQMNKKSLAPQISNIKFSDIAGYDEVKAELWEIVDFLKFPSKYNEVGARTPKGVLLSGPPGTGKTFFAKAVAGEAGIPFYSISGSDFVEMFVGVGAKRVRELFGQAKMTAPSLIFIDELDAVGRQRGAGMGGGNDEREQTLNQMLVEMDGFASNTGIVVVAATNRPDVLDPALKRPGRFDRSIEFRMPDIKERQSILEIYAKIGNKKFSKDVEWHNIAGRTPGFSAAELENVINESAILSIRLKSKEITLYIVDEAIDRVIGGPSKSNNLMSIEEKELIAYHESGHALIGLAMPKAEKVQKITIIPRGQAGGYVLMTPKKEKFVQTKSELEAKITSYMGGRASEEFFFGKDEISTGAFSDIEEATKIARRMVTEFGMSGLGPIQYEKVQGNVFLGRDYGSPEKHFSGQVGHEIDLEVRKIVDNAYKKAFDLISKNKELMDLFAEALLLKETLTSEEAEFIYKNKKLPKHVQLLKEPIKLKESSKKSTKNSVEKKDLDIKNLEEKKDLDSDKTDKEV